MLGIIGCIIGMRHRFSSHLALAGGHAALTSHDFDHGLTLPPLQSCVRTQLGAELGNASFVDLGT